MLTPYPLFLDFVLTSFDMIPIFPQTGDATLVLFNNLILRRQRLERRFRTLDASTLEHRMTCKTIRCLHYDGTPGNNPCPERQGLDTLWIVWRDEWQELHHQIEALTHIIEPDPDYPPTVPNSPHPPASDLFE